MLELYYNNYTYYDPSRMQYLWDHNTKRGIKLLIQKIWKQELIKENDVFIMDNIIKEVKSPTIL